MFTEPTPEHFFLYVDISQLVCKLSASRKKYIFMAYRDGKDKYVKSATTCMNLSNHSVTHAPLYRTSLPPTISP
jgi:hypothetical protein